MNRIVIYPEHHVHPVNLLFSFHGRYGAKKPEEHDHCSQEFAHIKRPTDAKAAECAPKSRQEGSYGDKYVPNRAVQQNTFAPEDPGRISCTADQGKRAVDIEKWG